MMVAIQKRKVVRQKTPEELLTIEWTDYLPELVSAIEAGYCDNILPGLIGAITARQRVHRSGGDVNLAPPQEPVSPIELASNKFWEHAKDDGMHVVDRAASVYDIVGKVVRIGVNGRPKWTIGLRVKVVRINTTTCEVEWVDDPIRYSQSGLATAKRFRLPNSLIDVAFDHAPPTRTSRRRY